MAAQVTTTGLAPATPSEKPVSCLAGDGAGKRYAGTEVSVAADEMTHDKLAKIYDRADTGDVKAQATLALVFREGKIVKRDFTKALAYARQAAAFDSVEAQYILGMMYLKGEGEPVNRKLGFEWLERAEAQGYIPAKAVLGTAYQSGWLGNPDPLRGLRLMGEAAVAGYSEAQLNLGYTYIQNYGPATNSEARCWMRRAADQGLDAALVAIADSYWDANKPTMPAEMENLYLKAFERGQMTALLGLADLYNLTDAFGEPQYAKTLPLLRKGVQQGYAPAKFILGWMYEYGWGVDHDNLAAEQLYMESAEDGYIRAQQHVAKVLSGRVGFDGAYLAEDLQDPVQADKWLRIAARDGSGKEDELQSEIERVLTPDELKQAKQGARDWLDAHPEQASSYVFVQAKPDSSK